MSFQLDIKHKIEEAKATNLSLLLSTKPNHIKILKISLHVNVKNKPSLIDGKT